mgnify:CR=1 FL=1
MLTQTGQSKLSNLDLTRLLPVKRFGKLATGLSRPDFFDWPKKLDELAEASDETFEDWWEGSKEGWKQLTRSMDSHWDEFSARVRNFFS